MALTTDSPNVLVSASSSIELHARTLFDDEVLGGGPAKGPELPDVESLNDGFVSCGGSSRRLVDAEAPVDKFEDCATLSEIADKLPDAESLADGFVDGSSEVAPHHILSEGEVSPSSIRTEHYARGLNSPVRSSSSRIEGFVLFTNDTLESGSASDKTTAELEKTRTFPVPLSEGLSVETPVVPTFSTTKSENQQVYGIGSGFELGKESGSESEGDECKMPSSSTALCTSSAVGRNHVSTEEPLQAILESKIAELESSCTEPSKCEDDDSKCVKVRKRQLKEIRALVEGTDRSAEEKLRQLNGKYLEQVGETRRLEKDFVSLNRKYKQVNKEKDNAQAELGKSIALRHKLESLCRELQRQNKILLDENKRVASEEEQKRQELSGRFHDTVKEITSKLEEQGDERVKQMQENELLREKLKHFTQQYDIREQHFAHQLRTKTLEHQLIEVKLKQQEDLYSQSECKSKMYCDQITQLRNTELELRSQLALYGDKFEQFQETLTKSNNIFATFKSEMETMSKTVKKLEKENSSLKKKCEKSDVSIIELLGERDIIRKQLQTTKLQKDKLESLCRSLQLERRQQYSISEGVSSMSSQVSRWTNENETNAIDQLKSSQVRLQPCLRCKLYPHQESSETRHYTPEIARYSRLSDAIYALLQDVHIEETLKKMIATQCRLNFL